MLAIIHNNVPDLDNFKAAIKSNITIIDENKL